MPRASQILGLSPSTVSRMANGTYTLDSHKKEWELGAVDSARGRIAYNRPPALNVSDKMGNS